MATYNHYSLSAGPTGLTSLEFAFLNAVVDEAASSDTVLVFNYASELPGQESGLLKIFGSNFFYNPSNQTFYGDTLTGFERTSPGGETRDSLTDFHYDGDFGAGFGRNFGLTDIFSLTTTTFATASMVEMKSRPRPATMSFMGMAEAMCSTVRAATMWFMAGQATI